MWKLCYCENCVNIKRTFQYTIKLKVHHMISQIFNPELKNYTLTGVAHMYISKFKFVIQIKPITNLGNCWSKSTWCSDTRGRHNFGGFCGQSWTRSDFYIKLKDSHDSDLSHAETIITVVWPFGKTKKIYKNDNYTIDRQWCYLKDLLEIPKSWVFLLPKLLHQKLVKLSQYSQVSIKRAARLPTYICS